MDTFTSRLQKLLLGGLAVLVSVAPAASEEVYGLQYPTLNTLPTISKSLFEEKSEVSEVSEEEAETPSETSEKQPETWVSALPTDQELMTRVAQLAHSFDATQRQALGKAPGRLTVDPSQPSGHRVMDLGAKQLSRGALSRGVRRTRRGAVVLKGAASRPRQGAFLSKAYQFPGRDGSAAPRSFRYMNSGVRGVSPEGTKMFVAARGVNPGKNVGEWKNAGIEKNFDMGGLFQAVQVLVVMLSNSKQSPAFQGATLAPIAPPPATTGSSSIFGLPTSGPGSRTGPGTGSGSPSTAATGTGTGATPGTPSPQAAAGTPAAGQTNTASGPGLSGLSIVPRAQWGARPTRETYKPHSPDRITIHHTEYPIRSYKGAASMRQVQDLHQNKNGWADVGYHFLIGPDGKIFEGRPVGMVGAHSGGLTNVNNVGIAVHGNFDKGDQLAGAQRASLYKLIKAVYQAYSIPKTKKILGHRDLKQTSCPSDQIYRQLSQIQAEALR